MRNLLFILIVLVGCMRLVAQVTIDPFFPELDDDITVYFDASQGSGGLNDCNCTVYMHTGLITDQSTSGSDWKYVQGNWGTDDPKVRMTKVANNIYILNYNIKDFYEVPDGEQVRQLAFVFRNVDGSKEGKTASGGDIFYAMPDPDAPFQYIVTKPSMEDRIVAPGALLDLKVVSSRNADYTFTVNGNIVSQKPETALFEVQYALSQREAYHFALNITYEEVDYDTVFTWIVPKDNLVAEVPPGTRLGFNPVSEGKATFLIDAPGKGAAFLVGDHSDWKVDQQFQMNKTPNGNSFWFDLDTTGLGSKLRYQIWLDDGLRLADPMSQQVLNDFDDRFISASVYPDMPAYPALLASGNVSYVTWEEPYQWQTHTFIRPEPGNLVVYELLVRDFLASHDYNDLADTLTYLKRLGVNAIELMPVCEFEGNISWGYNVSFHNAIDKYYGGPEKLKRFIDMAHGAGIAVIADVVFNHAFGQNPMVRMYWDAANNKPAADNPWFNQDPRHPFNVGYDFNHESPFTRRYVKEILENWLTEFRFDGYRFDLSKGFTQTDNPNDIGKWGQYDASRIAILKEYADVMWATSPGSYVILEHFADNSEERELANYGMMLWGNLTHDYQEAVMGYNSNFTWNYFKARNWTNPHVVGYMESHDEERIIYKAKQFGATSGTYSAKDEATALDRLGMASAFFYTIPGPKMLWQFGELGYDYSINYCQDGTIKDQCRTDPKPIRWDFYHQQKRLELYAVTAGLIHLKTENEVFRDADITYDLSATYKHMAMNEDELKMLVIGNFGLSGADKMVAFPSSEWYYNYLGNDSIPGSTVLNNIYLEQGAYKVYLNKKVHNPALTLSADKPTYEAMPVLVFPNPAGSEIYVNLGLQSVGAHLGLTIYDINGKEVYSTTTKGEHEVVIPAASFDPGVYIVRVGNGQRAGVAKFVVGSGR